MQFITVGIAVGLLALTGCDQVANDPDIQEATAAAKGALKDDGAALKAVRDEARAAKEAKPEKQNTDESQVGNTAGDDR
jgi:hypothetical protein